MKEINLTQGYVALVDDEDYDKLKKWKWSVIRSGVHVYARRAECVNGVYKTILLHRYIFGTIPDGFFIDHIDRNTLNDQKYNLRLCTASQNGMNSKIKTTTTSVYKGVCALKIRKRFRATISINRKHIHIGTFKTEVEAAIAYNTKAVELFGNFAKLNII